MLKNHASRAEVVSCPSFPSLRECWSPFTVRLTRGSVQHVFSSPSRPPPPAHLPTRHRDGELKTLCIMATMYKAVNVSNDTYKELQNIATQLQKPKAQVIDILVQVYKKATKESEKAKLEQFN